MTCAGGRGSGKLSPGRWPTRAGRFGCPSTWSNACSKLSGAERTLVRTLDRDPTIDEIAEELEWSKDMVESLMTLRQHTVSLETPVGEEQSILEDFIEDTSGWTPDEVAI